MSNDFYTILTNAGLAAIANASVSNSTVNFAKVAVGDGNGAYYTPTLDMTALRNQTWEGTVTSVQVDENNPNWINVESVIPASDGGFYIREIGIFNDANVLLAIGKLPETYKPEMESGSTKDLYLKAIFEVTNASVISMKADPSVVLASKKYIDDKVAVVSGNLSTLQQQVTTYLADYSRFKTQVEGTISEISDPEMGVEAKLNEHLAESATTTTKGHVQLSNDTNSNSETLAPTMKALNEVKQFANDGKKAVANAVTAKGVTASPSDTFTTLATKIGQINTGSSKGASGTGQIPGLVFSGYYYTLSVRGLAFNPTHVMVKWTGASWPFRVQSFVEPKTFWRKDWEPSGWLEDFYITSITQVNGGFDVQIYIRLSAYSEVGTVYSFNWWAWD